MPAGIVQRAWTPRPLFGIGVTLYNDVTVSVYVESALRIEALRLWPWARGFDGVVGSVKGAEKGFVGCASGI